MEKLLPCHPYDTANRCYGQSPGLGPRLVEGARERPTRDTPPAGVGASGEEVGEGVDQEADEAAHESAVYADEL